MASTTGTFQPDKPVDPIVLSMLTWFANAIENESLQKYWGDRRNAQPIRAILASALASIKALPVLPAIAAECPFDCPEPPCVPTCQHE